MYKIRHFVTVILMLKLSAILFCERKRQTQLFIGYVFSGTGHNERTNFTRIFIKIQYNKKFCISVQFFFLLTIYNKTINPRQSVSKLKHTRSWL